MTHDYALFLSRLGRSGSTELAEVLALQRLARSVHIPSGALEREAPAERPHGLSHGHGTGSWVRDSPLRVADLLDVVICKRAVEDHHLVDESVEMTVL
jgi:hypothetical protein